MKKKGLIQVYTGDGKGKTTAAIGQSIRALGHGKKVCIIQLFKPSHFYGEQKVLKRLKNLDFFSYSDRHPSMYKNVKIMHVKQECVKALNHVKKIFSGNKYDILVLDEFNIAIRDGYIDFNALIGLLKKKPLKLEVIITGREAPQELIDFAGLVTSMEKIKHPFDGKIVSRESIDY